MLLVILMVHTISPVGIFLYMTFTLDAEYALCAPVLVLLAIMTYSMLQRKSGAYRQRWVEKGAKDLFKAAAAAKAATSAGAPANMLPSVSVAAPTTATPISEEDPFALLRVAVTG